jgi:two-component sensor histidine kinase
VIALFLFAFGALTFSVLTLHYWRSGASRRDPVFAVFTLACAAAFAINILLRIEVRWELPLSAALDLVTGLIPPLLLHLVSRDQGRPIRIAFYAVGSATSVAFALDDVSLVSLPFRGEEPAMMLAAAGALGLVFVKRESSHLLLWYRILLSLMVVVTITDLFDPSVITSLAPDYLVLSIFCVTLYYRERIVFFDLLIKRGAFLCCSMAATAFLLSAAQIPDRLMLTLILSPLLLVAPWADATLGRWLDRIFLRRRYSPDQAERLFTSELQLPATESDFRATAERCLSELFQCTAEVRFQSEAEPHSPGDLLADLGGGYVLLRQRPSGIPYMSDDRRLLDSLARTLRVTRENVRFREEQQRQHEREQQLRLLASRAELKALRAQINPHFLFNTLNAIAGFIPLQPDLADQAIEQLAQVFRYVLRKSDSEWARLDEEAEFAKAYLSLEQARFRERLRVELAIDPGASAVSVPAMCIQPLIENAIRHGTSAVEGTGIVGLRIHVNGSTTSIEVTDNGPGFPSGFSLAGSAGHGLRNIAERLKGYYGDSARLSWEHVANSTRVRLQVPHTSERAR